LGFYSATANGVWGAQTQQALSDFELVNGVSPKTVFTYAMQARLFANTAIHAIPTQASAYAGEWASDISQCQEGEDARVLITLKRAEAFGVSCDFNSIQRETSAWRIQARCTHDAETWIAHIRLLRAQNRLIWSSERGTAEYVQCSETHR